MAEELDMELEKIMKDLFISIENRMNDTQNYVKQLQEENRYLKSMYDQYIEDRKILDDEMNQLANEKHKFYTGRMHRLSLEEERRLLDKEKREFELYKNSIMGLLDLNK
jgi:hypothetical protein